MEPHVYVWSWSGELLEAVPLAEFAINHDIDQRRLLTELLLVQAVEFGTNVEHEPRFVFAAAGNLSPIGELTSFPTAA